MITAIHKRICARAHAGRPLVISALALAALLPAGCANWSYGRVQLGQHLREYERVFPEGKSRRTERTLCFLEQDYMGRTDAVVVLLTRDRQVCGKLHATNFRRKYGLKVETGFILRGEVDPVLARYSGTGPIDMLRAIADDLTSDMPDSFTREAHGWVAAGLVRLIQRWPHLGDEGPAFPRLTDMLERVPGGGRAGITVDPQGVYVLEYTQGKTF
ncbi:MAG: hypothetical protein KAY37_07315 [Phycisphaerae bacterium]|nr:hypothetical protein [Phycisphaerae bacterium]